MNRLKSIKMLALLAMWCVSSPLFAQDNVIDEVVWVVGDEAILKSDVESERLNALLSNVKLDGDPYCVIPEQLAIQKLYLHQAELDSIEVPEQDILRSVENELNSRIEDFGSKEKMEEYYGMTQTKIREKFQEMFRNQMLVQRTQMNLVGDIKLVPADVRRYFKNLPQDSIPFVPTQVEVQILMLEPKITQEEIDRVKSTLRDYAQQIEKGESSFGVLARLYSEDPGSARKGGEYPFTSRGALVPEFSNVVFNLTDPKKVSKVFETEYGYHIAQLIEKRGDRVSYRHILIKPKVDEKELEAGLLRLDSIANDVRKGTFTFEEAATYLSQDKDTRNNKGLMVNPNTGTARFEMQDLAQVSQEIAVAVEGLNIGEISKPIVMLNKRGKEVCAIVKLKSRIDGHKATMSEDYQRLKAIVQDKLAQEKLEKWIREKQKKTYVRINENWVNCEFKYPGWIKEE